MQSGGWTINWQGTRENYKGATTILEGLRKMSTGQVVFDKEGTGSHVDADIAVIVVVKLPMQNFLETSVAK
ncbi:MAG: hypothetical protein U5K54_09155 [Cytophagales bacterium]|nr:hypothetical protein [Cytophagales bacterium]